MLRLSRSAPLAVFAVVGLCHTVLADNPATSLDALAKPASLGELPPLALATPTTTAFPELQPPPGTPGSPTSAPPNTPSTPATPGSAGQQPPQLEPVKIIASPDGLLEQDLVGSYNQPRWTTRRIFDGTRVYVLPEGDVEVEAWARSTIGRSDGTEWRFLQEVQFGLPYRFQVDLYLREDSTTTQDDTLMGGQFEVRWALADWNEIWGNPTLYMEYIVLEGRPDKIEPKLLLGGDIAPRWHWGANAVAEMELGGLKEYEYELTGGVEYSLIDDVLNIGVEGTASWIDDMTERGHYHHEVYFGPAIQWRPVDNLTINFAPLVGMTGGSGAAQIWLNVGWKF